MKVISLLFANLPIEIETVAQKGAHHRVLQPELAAYPFRGVPFHIDTATWQAHPHEQESKHPAD